MTSAVVAFSLFASVTAHMKLENPVPYSSDSLNNSPLDRSGSDYPCKMRSGGYEITKMNNWKAGEKQTISFIGSAVHGGGSCQFALTTDMEPSPQSQFKVIHSVIGGCPSNVTGNLPENSAGHGAATFDIELPKDIPNGQYSFAWTWFNKVGNREMYMNCAPLTVTGGGKDKSVLAKLPDLFVANIPETSCATVENFDFAFPEPGNAVETIAGAAVGNKLNGAGCAQMTKMGAGAGNIGSPAAPTDGPVDAPSSTQAPKVTAAPSAYPSGSPPGVFVPGVSSGSDQVQTSFTTLIATKTAEQPDPTSEPKQPKQPDSSSLVSPPQGTGTAPPPATGSGVPCKDDGAVVCISATQFGLCNWGSAVPQDLPAGMVCQDGAIVGAAAKRHRRAHAGRTRLHGGGSS
ncbi:hypothetical protein GQ43DRAFT_447979 [Delitschia confertaspora ATCC 74209]|uniref:Lytic polysaccharide monooxygenase n=1 Tax=Delitschia confertaspora ATCC 74209 TaxID=1513339 RepID=A0A9P4JN75_9PLEO|nr:hypothetical protein GQ43DRAFT_447979 [Delitschia confertaspora ATCC 74209]